MIKILTKSRRAGTIKAVQARLYFITQGKTDVNGNFGRIDLAPEELTNAPACSLIRPFSREAIFAFSIQYSRSGPSGTLFDDGALAPKAGVASGGELFTAEKFPKRAGGCGPRSPLGLRGVHPKKRHLPGRYAPPGCPVPYCPPLPGFARASRIGWPLRLQGFPLRPPAVPWNVAGCCTRQHYNPSVMPLA